MGATLTFNMLNKIAFARLTDFRQSNIPVSSAWVKQQTFDKFEF